MADETNIVVATDCSDFASAEIKLALVSAFRARHLTCRIEVVHTQAFSVENVAFILRQLAEHSPSGSAFLPVVNAEPREQARVIGRTRDRDFVYVGRATGALDWLIGDLGSSDHREIKDIGFRPFGGRSIYPEILAAYIAGELSQQDAPTCIFRVGPPCPSGRIVHIDNFGNCKLHRYLDNCTERSKALTVRVNGCRTFEARRCIRPMSEPPGVLLIYPGARSVVSRNLR